MPVLQEQARALGDPTRHAIFRTIAAAGRPVGITELNEAHPLHHNAIRQHVAKLVAAGLVTESTVARGGRGRPRLAYAVAPAAEGRWGTTGPYERLSALLVEIISTGRPAREVGRRAAGSFRAPSPAGSTVADVGAAMARHGFDPEVRGRSDGADGAEIVLRACPFVTAAVADPDTVCALHLGLAEGLVAGTELAVEELVAHDPHAARCVLTLRPAGAPTGAATLPGTLALRGPRAMP